MPKTSGEPDQPHTAPPVRARRVAARRLRVGFDYRPALLGRSGIPRAVRELARALADVEDIDLRLFGHSWARPIETPSVPTGARLCRTRLPGRALPGLARLGLGAERLCGGAAVFHWTDFVHPPVGRRTRVVMTLHDCAFAVEPRWHGESATDLATRARAAAARADVVVCPTHATAADAEDRLGVPRDRLRIVPFGADHGVAADPRPPWDGRRYVLMLGTIEPRKNHVRALHAWRALGAERPALVVVGRRGWCCDDAVDALSRAVDREDVTWLQNADDRTVATLLAHASALLYPSLFEGFGFPPLEAFRHGVPVVCGETPALREVAGDAAFCCDPTDEDALADALATALASDSEAARNARRTRAARFRWDECGRAHAAIYREVLSR